MAWLNECSWHQLSTIAQPWAAPISVLGHNRHTFSLFLSAQSSLFPLPWVRCFISSSVQNAGGGGNNLTVTLVFDLCWCHLHRVGQKGLCSSCSCHIRRNLRWSAPPVSDNSTERKFTNKNLCIRVSRRDVNQDYKDTEDSELASVSLTKSLKFIDISKGENSKNWISSSKINDTTVISVFTWFSTSRKLFWH